VPESILVLNSGSSSLRFALLERQQDGTFARRHRGHYSDMSHADALDAVLEWIDGLPEAARLVAVGHRVVHGGSEHTAPAILDAALIARLKALIPLAPLHQPQALAAVECLAALRPGLPQVACFDTAFHRTMPWPEQRLALPAALHADGVQRFGFHGLSYEFIAGRLAELWGERAGGRIVVAHLGQGSSLCAMHELTSRATSMGFTPLDGVPMGTRSGALDAAVPLYLADRGMSTAEIRTLLHEQSGLLGLSGISGDMRALLADPRAEARAAVDFFCHHVARAVASLASAIGGLDALVFTGGIGQHAPLVRARIVERCAWLGAQLEAAANEAADPHEDAACITRSGSPVHAWVVATDEEAVIARHTVQAYLGKSGAAG
jgi:acetate kinase